MSTEARIVVAADDEDLAARASQLVLDAEREAIGASGSFRIALAGGSTPRGLYERLAVADASFHCWEVFFGDERWVPHGDADSNARMARETLLDRVPIPRTQIHAIDTGAGTPEKAAELYAWILRRHLPRGPHGTPQFDMVILGMGADGHTASLLPGSPALDAPPERICVASYAPALAAWRVTLTLPLINAASRILFLVSGADKAVAVSRVLEDRDATLPAARVQAASGELTWIVDEAAASGLTVRPDTPGRQLAGSA